MAKCVKILRDMYYRSNRIYVGLSSLKNFRTIHCNGILQIKMFMEHENKYAYNVLESKGYVSKMYTLSNALPISTEEFNIMIKENWSTKSPKEIFEAFPIFGTYSFNCGLCISNKMFDTYIDELTDNLKHASDEELQSLFYALLRWPETTSIRTRNFIEVWVALDDECLKRMNKWSFNEILSFVGLFYMLNVVKPCDFTSKALNKLATKAKLLTQGQLVQTMFFIGVMRRSPFDVHNLEIQLINNFTAFSIDELAIMSMGFFKSKTPIRSPDLMLKIVNKVIDNSKDIHEVSLAALLKIIRYSLKLSVDNIVYKMLEKLQFEIPRLSIMCNVQVGLVGMPTLTLHKGCLTEIAETTTKCISETRLKDLERLVLIFGTFNFAPATKENFFETVIEELRKPERISEIENHGKSFACCIAYLGHSSLYPVDLMDKVLSSEFLLHNYGKQIFNYGREILAIHNTAQIFCSDADMNRLNDKVAIILAKKYTDFIPNENYQKQYNKSERMIIDILNILKEDRGDDYVIGDHILTHHQRGDIIVCNDINGSPVQVKKHFKQADFGTLRYPPDDNVWVVLVVGGKNATIQNTDVATGPFQAKMRELRALGYRTSLILWSKYSSLETKEEKINYLNSLINEAIEKS